MDLQKECIYFHSLAWRCPKYKITLYIYFSYRRIKMSNFLNSTKIIYLKLYPILSSHNIIFSELLPNILRLQYFKYWNCDVHFFFIKVDLFSVEEVNIMWVGWLAKVTKLLFLFIELLDMGRVKFVSLSFEIIKVCIFICKISYLGLG